MHSHPPMPTMLEDYGLLFVDNRSLPVEADGRGDIVEEQRQVVTEGPNPAVRGNTAQHSEAVLTFPPCPECLIFRTGFEPLVGGVEHESCVVAEPGEVLRRAMVCEIINNAIRGLENSGLVK